MSAQIALRVHRLLDLPAFLLAAGADSEAHLTYLPGLLTLFVESWLPAQRDPAAGDLFSTRIQESFFRAQMSAQIALRVHRLLDLPAFLLAAGADSEAHLTYLPGLLTLLSTSGRYVEEWVRVFYASVWIDPDHHWMRFRFEREDVTITASQIRQLFGFHESSTRLHSLCYGTSDPPRRPHGGVAPGTAHVAALFKPPFIDGSRRSPADFTSTTKYLYQVMRRTLLPRMGYREANTHLLDLPAFLLAAGAESEAHLTYLPGLLSFLTISGRYVEEWVRVFYASVWIDPDHQWMRFRFEREDVTITASQIRQLFGFPDSTTRLHSLCYGTSDPPRRPHGGVAPGTAHVAALFRPPFTDGSRRSPADFTTAAKYLYELIRRTLLPRMGYREATTHTF